jgi:hypothetical protein
LCKNKINDKARAVEAAAGDKVTPAVRETDQEDRSQRVALNPVSHHYIRELFKISKTTPREIPIQCF